LIAVCGNIVQDVLVRPVREPLRWGASVVAESIVISLGGNAGTTSYALGKLGIPVKVISLVGKDAAAETVLARLHSAGVDTTFVKATAAATSVALSLVGERGERAILYQLGASAECFDDDLALPVGATHFHLAAVYRMAYLRRRAPEYLRKAKEAGLTTSVDTQWDHEGEWMRVLRPSLPYTDLLFVNEDEGRELTSEREPANIAGVLRELGAKDVVVKLGERGCFASTSEGEFTSPARVVPVIDTTGAGDCFVAGYLAARFHGNRHREAAEQGNYVASLSVQALGASDGLK
jgi:sugar/nucleoside kinase (ribokinase family)